MKSLPRGGPFVLFLRRSLRNSDSRYPFRLTTGRVVYHWHTRTKTGRSKALNEAAPEAFSQLSPQDAVRLGVRDGDLVEVESRRGRICVQARVGEIRPGHEPRLPWRRPWPPKRRRLPLNSAPR
jgi:anaerobic selenocysteine-containing dehydrogenase